MDDILAKVGEFLAEVGEGGIREVQINRPWLCQKDHGHVLGVSIRVKVGDRYQDRLLKFRRAVDPRADAPAEVEVDCEVKGTAYDIRCSVEGCGATRTWWDGEAALERFLETQERK